jgi:hypothetical protein
MKLQEKYDLETKNTDLCQKVDQTSDMPICTSENVQKTVSEMYNVAY